MANANIDNPDWLRHTEGILEEVKLIAIGVSFYQLAAPNAGIVRSTK